MFIVYFFAIIINTMFISQTWVLRSTSSFDESHQRRVGSSFFFFCITVRVDQI